VTAPDHGVRDDATIQDTNRTLRRIPQSHVVWGDDGRPRPTSQAFADDEEGEHSVYLEELLLADTVLDETAPLIDHPGYGLVALAVGSVRSLNLGVAPDPIDYMNRRPDEAAHPCDFAHALIDGNKSTPRRRKLAKAAAWVVEIEPAIPRPT